LAITSARRGARLLLRRPNPTYEAFCAAMPEVTWDITAWLWEALQVYASRN
jgi:hypothetical protein